MWFQGSMAEINFYQLKLFVSTLSILFIFMWGTYVRIVDMLRET
jgi:hypothetical protein